jgi:hypothetical protein
MEYNGKTQKQIRNEYQRNKMHALLSHKPVRYTIGGSPNSSSLIAKLTNNCSAIS